MLSSVVLLLVCCETQIIRLSPIKKRTRVVVFKFSLFIESFSSVRGNREIYTLIYVLLSDSVCRDCELVAAGVVLNSY